jgi:hypothetical protein
MWCPLRFLHNMMFGSSLSPVVCRRAHVLFMLFVFVCSHIVAVSFIGEGNQRNHRTAASHWPTSSHNIISSIPRLGGIRTLKGDNHTGDVIWWTNIMGFDTLCLTIAFVNITTLLANITILIFLLCYTGSASWGGNCSVFVVTCSLKI